VRGRRWGDDAQRAVEQVNAGTAPFFVQEFVQESGPVASCQIAPRPEREREMLLAVVTKSNYWLQGRSTSTRRCAERTSRRDGTSTRTCSRS